MGLIGPEQEELFALELVKNAVLDFAYALAFVNINRSASNWVKNYVFHAVCILTLSKTTNFSLFQTERFCR